MILPTPPAHIDTVSHLVAHLLDVSPDNISDKDTIAGACRRVRELDGDASEWTSDVVRSLLYSYGIPICGTRDTVTYSEMTLGQLADYLSSNRPD